MFKGKKNAPPNPPQAPILDQEMVPVQSAPQPQMDLRPKSAVPSQP